MFNRKNKITKLKLKLRKRGLRFRKDSSLCSSYINGKTDLNVNVIVQKMCELNYLYEYCDLKNIKYDLYNDYVTNGFVKNYEGTVTSQAKKIALEKYSNGEYPHVFPWEKNNEKNNENNIKNETVEENDDGELDGGKDNIYNTFILLMSCYFLLMGVMLISMCLMFE